MAFEKEKAEIRKRFSDLQKKEPIYLAGVTVGEKERDPKTGRLYYPVEHIHLGAMPHPAALRTVLERLDAIKEYVIKEAKKQGWRIK